MKKGSIPLIAGLFLATTIPAIAGDMSEQQILSMKGGSSAAEAQSITAPFTDARQRAVEMAGETLGSQAGYCAGVHHWNEWANDNAAILDKAFRFSSLLLDGGRVLPPVILQDNRSFRQHGNDLAITAQTTWEIYREGKIVSTAPNWRGYLLQSCGKPLQPNAVLLPKDAADEIAWHRGVEEGWKQGEMAAKNGFLLGLHRLTRDYAGMIRFWWLSQRGIVQAPILSTGEVGIRVNGRTLNVGERIFRLTDSGSFRMPSHWIPLAIPLTNPGKGLPLIRLDQK